MIRTFLALALLAPALAALAAPTLGGPSGLILTPTTCIVPVDQYYGVVSYCPAAKETVTAVTFAPRADFEVGVAEYHRTADALAGVVPENRGAVAPLPIDSDRKCLDVKYQYQLETSSQMGIAAGIEGISHRGHPEYYGDVSSQLKGLTSDTIPVARGFLGVGAGGGNDNDPMLPIHGVFTGIVVANSNYTALAEYDSSCVNASLRAVIQGPVSAQVAWIGSSHVPVYAVTYMEK